MTGILYRLIKPENQVIFVGRHIQLVDIKAQEPKIARESWAESSALAIKTWVG